MIDRSVGRFASGCSYHRVQLDVESLLRVVPEDDRILDVLADPVVDIQEMLQPPRVVIERVVHSPLVHSRTVRHCKGQAVGDVFIDEDVTDSKISSLVKVLFSLKSDAVEPLCAVR